MSKVTIKIHINQDLERTENFDTSLDRSAFIDINRDDVELQTLTEDIPRLFREYKDIKSTIRHQTYSIHYYSYTEGDVEIDNNDDLITEIDVIFPEPTSDEESDEKCNHINKYIDIRAVFKQKEKQNNDANNENSIECIPGKPDFVYKQAKTRKNPPANPNNNCINDVYPKNMKQKRRYNSCRNRGIECVKLDILPYRWQLRVDIKDEGVNLQLNENDNELEYDNDVKDDNMYYWKNQSIQQSFYYEQRFNKNGKTFLDKTSFSDSFHTVRRKTRFEGRILKVSKQRGFGYLTPNYPQKDDRNYGVFFHFEQAFPEQFYHRNCIIECERGWKVSFELRMFNKIKNSHKYKKSSYRGINLKILSKENALHSPLHIISDQMSEFERKNEEEFINENAGRFTGEVVKVLADKLDGYVKDTQFGLLIVFKFNECHGFDPFDLREGTVIEYELRHDFNTNVHRRYAINICIGLLPYEWHTFDEKSNEWICESIENAKYLERNYKQLNENKKRKRLHRFERKVVKINKQERIGYVEMNYNRNIGLKFSFNDCEFDWNALKVGDDIVYELERIEANNIIYWKVVNVKYAPKYKKVVVWKWRENENDKYKEYDDKNMSMVLETLNVNQSSQLGPARCVTKMAMDECYDVDSFNDTFCHVKRFEINVLQ